MVNSMRARLTLWYTGVLALVLVVFAFVTYSYLARAARERTDRTLADTTDSLASNFTAELNDEGMPAADAATEVTGNFQFKDRQAIIFDDRGETLAASESPTGAKRERAWPELKALAQSLSGLMESAKRSGRAVATVPAGKEGIRAFATTLRSKEKTYAVVVALSLGEEDESLEQARNAFYLAVPLALLIASLGGYFLARKSLAPVVEMGERAARIGASTLNERLPVPHPRSELGQLARIFNDLLARLDRSFEQQRRFMADASHELRTPVAIVCGEAEVTLSQKVRSSEEYRESLAILLDEGRRLTRIVEDLFTLTRADAGQHEAATTIFYLDETVGECVRAVRSLAAQHGLEVQCRQAAEELLFRGDEGLIRRMILNLLDNAIKYTPTGGRIGVETTRDAEGYIIRITDTGAGIPPEAQAHIFERFYRADPARSRRNGKDGGSSSSVGAGLGLSIASWIAETHGGRIALERSDQTGSTFLIILPATF